MRNVIWIILIPLTNLIYLPLNNDNGHVHSLLTKVDQIIPFTPLFVLPYLAWHAFVYFNLIRIMLIDRKSYYLSVAFTVTGIFICFGFFKVFQTTVPRPLVTSSNLLCSLTNSIYRTDNPYNTFPSIHVFTTYLVLRVTYFIKLAPVEKLLNTMLGVLIIFSTLFIKQHCLADVLAGFILGEVIYLAFVQSYGRIHWKNINLIRHRSK